MTKRRGFTLLEVALAVVVGLSIMYGVFLSYEAKKESAGNSIARERLTNAMGTMEAYVASKGSLPVSGSGEFSRSWAALHPDEKALSPWGGATGDPTLGVSEDPPLAQGNLDASQAPDVTGTSTVDPTRQSNLYYRSLANTAQFVKVGSRANPTPQAFHGYVLGIYDAKGNPWQWVAGGK
jgi:prepilin-type N-terminal cleavage/methylation domain-containing protein